MEVGAVAEVGEHVRVLRERRLADPGHAFAAHLVKVLVLRSIHTDMKWQPMPAIAREPSGTRVLVLCGQPLQNQGARSPVSVFIRGHGALALRITSIGDGGQRRVRGDVARPGAKPSFFRRLAMALGDDRRRQVGLARSSQFSLGLGMDHLAAGDRLRLVELAQHVGRTSGRQL